MIINRNDLEKGILDEAIIRQIKLLAKHKMRYNFEPIELKFCIKEIKEEEGYR